MLVRRQGSPAVVLAVCAAVWIAATPLPAEGPAPGALVVDGSALVPFRYIGEWLGAQVGFEGATRTVTLTLGETNVSLQLGSRQAQVNGQAVALATAALERDGVTYVPLRFVAEALGAKVEWDGAHRLVRVCRPGTEEALVLQALLPGEVRPKDGRWVGGAGGAIVSLIVSGGGLMVSSMTLDGDPPAKGVLATQCRTAEDGYPIVGGKFGRAEELYPTGTFTTPTPAHGVWRLVVYHEDPGAPGLLNEAIGPRRLDWKWTARWTGPAPEPKGTPGPAQ